MLEVEIYIYDENKLRDEINLTFMTKCICETV